MYCFFDGRDDGTEYDEFRKSSGFTQEKYLERVRRTALYLVERLGNADVLVLEEIEDAGVLRDLLDYGLKSVGFRYFGLAQNETGMLSVGFLSKDEPLDVKVHGIEGSRLILELEFLVGGESVHVYGIHGKSKVSDEDGTVRKEEFTLLSSLARDTEGAVILCGDFNSDPADGGKEMGILRGPHAVDCPLLVTGDGGATKDGVFYSPFFDYETKPEVEGTYFYDGSWSFLDHILLDRRSFDGQGLEYDSSTVLHPKEATDYSGRPSRYEVSTGQGFSDHFAVSVTLRYT
ncbi:MAG: endonuclease/exonuclease/phosphatase family protein [Spirochaetales bacterium]|nr:endonuclease/exonuclease/phosphatase family protein [Candidatus Physcosoma equi]